MGETLLEVRDLVAGYGRSTVIRGASLTVDNAEIVGLVGRNGAGKSTFAKCVSGVVSRRGGDVHLAGTALPSSPPAVARAGVAHVPQGRGLFAGLSVRDNIRTGAVAVGQDVDGQLMAEILELFPQIGDLLQQRAGTLSGGQQQMVAIARGLAARPRVMIIDELSLGLAPVVIDAVWGTLEVLRDTRGLSIFIIDQNLARMTAGCDRLYRLDDGCTHLMDDKERERSTRLIL